MVKALIFVTFFAFFSSAIHSLENTSMGNSCSQNSNFNISSFSVAPYPLTQGANAIMTITGVFGQGEYIHEISTGIQYSNQWNYQYYYVDQSFSSGENVTFSVPINTPNYHGNFLAQVTLDDYNNGQFAACWSFSFIY